MGAQRREMTIAKRWRGRILISIFLGILSLTGIFLCSIHHIRGDFTVDDSQSQSRLFDAFQALAEAERRGGDVSSLVDDFNRIITNIRDAESYGNERLLVETLSMLDDVSKRAGEVGDQGATALWRRKVFTGVALGVEGVLGVIVYLYVPRIFWDLWVKVKKRWRVKVVEK